MSFGISLPPELRPAVDAYREQFEREHPGVDLSVAKAVKNLLSKALINAGIPVREDDAASPPPAPDGPPTAAAKAS